MLQQQHLHHCPARLTLLQLGLQLQRMLLLLQQQ
jgi:hypothetical protein